MEFRLLGPLEVKDGDVVVPVAAGKQRALLAALLLDANHTVPSSRLVDDLWGDDVPASAPKMVQIYVSRLRKTLVDGRLETRGGGYALRVEPGELDLHRFQGIVAEARAASPDDPEQASRLFAEALSLWRGPALAEFDEPFARIAAAHLEELRLSTAEEAIDVGLELGRHAELVAEIEQLVARHPHRERLRRQQLLALYRSGRQTEALEAYAAFRQALDAELGISPSQTLRELERAILNQDPRLLAPSPSDRGPGSRARSARRALGRSRERDALASALHSARAGKAAVVFVAGDVGVGKTTFVDSFLEHERTGDVLVGRGQCLDQRGAGEAFLPLLDAVAGLARGDDAVPGLLATHAPTWTLQMPWLVPSEALEDVRQRAAGATGERMLRELAEALVAIARLRPVVIVLEDLHWSDPSTLDAIELVARRREAAPILVLATYTSGAATGAEALASTLAARHLCEVVELGPLGADELAALVEERLPGTGRADELAAALLARTAGNPLFCENVLEAWVEAGAVRKAGAHWHVAPDFDRLSRAVPATLRELVLRELDAHRDEERALLEAASVAGGDVPSRALALAVGGDPVHTDAVCAALARRSRLLARADDAPWPDGSTSPTYRFVHDLYEQVVYEQIAPVRGAELHAAYARELEAAWGDRAPEIAPALAAHALRAGLAERAITFLRLTAEVALDRTAHREAGDLLSKALETLGELPAGADRDRLELELRTLLGRACVIRDGWSSEDAESEFLAAVELCERLDDREPLVPVLIALATVYEVRGEFERAHEILDRSLEIVDAGETDRRIEAHEVLACSLLHRGSFTQALEHAEHGVELFRSSSYRPVVVSLGDDSAVACHDWLALALWFVGFPDQARDRAHEAVDITGEPGRGYGRAAAMAQATVVHQCRREVGETLGWATRTIDLSEELRYTYRAAMGRILAGWARALAGDAEAGIAELRRGIDATRATGIRMDDAYFLGLLADACLASGDVAEGLEAAEEGLRQAGDPAESFYGAELLRLRGELRIVGRDGGGLDDLRRAADVSRRQQARSLELRATASLVRHGESDAVEQLRSLVELFDEGDETLDLVEARDLAATASSTRDVRPGSRRE